MAARQVLHDRKPCPVRLPTGSPPEDRCGGQFRGRFNATGDWRTSIRERVEPVEEIVRSIADTTSKVCGDEGVECALAVQLLEATQILQRALIALDDIVDRVEQRSGATDHIRTVGREITAVHLAGERIGLPRRLA